MNKSIDPPTSVESKKTPSGASFTDDRVSSQSGANSSPNLQKTLLDQQNAFLRFKDEMNRKLSRLTDENWGKDLEIETLRKLHAAEESVALRWKTECSRLASQTHENVQRHEQLEKQLMETRSELADKAQELAEASGLIAALEQSLSTANEELSQVSDELQAQKNNSAQVLNTLRIQHTKQFEQFHVRESQLLGEIEKLRFANSSMEGKLSEATEINNQLRHALTNTELETARGFSELQLRLQEEFQAQFETVLSENKKYRQMLEVRDTQTETDRSNLKQWQEQLNFLDQHLRQTKDSLKRDRAELLRFAKILSDELQQTRNHPFKDFMELTEIEFKSLQTQLSNMSTLSPTRGKLEERLSQMSQQRETVSRLIANSQKQVEERLQALTQITKAASVTL